EGQRERRRVAERTPLRDPWTQLSRNNLALVGSLLAVLFGLAAIFGPIAAPQDPAHQDLFNTFARPLSHGHLLGTDQLGRDILSRLLQGIRISMAVGVVTTAAVLVVGSVMGMVAGYYRGWVDRLIHGLVGVVWG